MKIKQCQPIDGWRPFYFTTAIALPSGVGFFYGEGKKSIIGAVSEEEMCVKSGNSKGSKTEEEDERWAL